MRWKSSSKVFWISSHLRLLGIPPKRVKTVTRNANFADVTSPWSWEGLFGRWKGTFFVAIMELVLLEMTYVHWLYSVLRWYTVHVKAKPLINRWPFYNIHCSWPTIYQYIVIYQQPRQLIYNLPTAFWQSWQPTNNLPTTYQQLDNNLITTYQQFASNLLTTDRQPTNNLLTTTDNWMTT